MLRTGFTIIFCTALALPGAFAAGKKQADTAGSGNAQTITVTDLAGRNVTIKMPVKKAHISWSGTGGAFMTMSALLGKDVANYISSWDGDLEEFRFDVWEYYRSVIPALEQIPDFGDPEFDDLNLEKLIASKPDVVIWTLAERQQAEATAEPALKQAGIPVVYIDYQSETLENHSRSTRLLGTLFGNERQAEEMISYYTDNLNLITKRIAGIQNKPVVYVEVAYQGPNTYGTTYSHSYSWGAMIAKAGGISLGEGKVIKSGTLEAETVISGNPDRVVFCGSYWPDRPESLRLGYLSSEADTQRLLGNYLKRPGWDTMTAVKNKNVFAVYYALGFNMYDIVCIAFLAKCIHPDLFTDIDPMAMLQEYYTRFMPYDISGIWMTQLQ